MTRRQTYEQATCNISKQSAMTKIWKESKIRIWDECTMSHMHIGRTWPDIERSAQWPEMFWRRNLFIAWRFSPNNDSHSKIDCFRWNKRLPKIIISGAQCEETSTGNKHESYIAERSINWRFILAIDYRRMLCFCRRIERIDIISSEFLQFRFIERWAHEENVPEYHS